MYRIPTILTADEIIDKAFRKSAKIPYRGRKEESIARVTSFSDTISHTLIKYVKRFPSLDRMHPFYREIIDIGIGLDNLKKSLSNIQWASEKIIHILKDEKKMMTEENHKKIRKRIYGRISSVVKRINGDLQRLKKAREVIKNLPELQEDAVTVVMAGQPNVGKSSIIRALSTAEPEVASYPFTTKKIIVGHRREYGRTYQFIDTPGLLNRSENERNDIEKTAIAALRYATDIIIFVLDPTEECGYTMESQENLMKKILDDFRTPIIIVESKSDIIKRNTKNITVSSVTGEGLDELMNRIREISDTLHIPERS